MPIYAKQASDKYAFIPVQSQVYTILIGYSSRIQAVAKL